MVLSAAAAAETIVSDDDMTTLLSSPDRRFPDETLPWLDPDSANACDCSPDWWPSGPDPVLSPTFGTNSLPGTASLNLVYDDISSRWQVTSWELENAPAVDLQVYTSGAELSLPDAEFTPFPWFQA